MKNKYDIEEYLKVWDETEKGLEVVVNDNFELKEIDGSFYIIKKKPKYPNTYEECCEILGCKADGFYTEFDFNNLDEEISEYEDKVDDLLQNFRKLIYYRDAYWKIAGDWKPDWTDNNTCYYAIATTKGDIGLMSSLYIDNGILVFPTEEMRDAFYENFKELIEECKELL